MFFVVEPSSDFNRDSEWLFRSSWNEESDHALCAATDRGSAPCESSGPTRSPSICLVGSSVNAPVSEVSEPPYISRLNSTDLVQFNCTAPMARVTRPGNPSPKRVASDPIARRPRLGSPGGVSVRIGQTSGITYVANSESVLRSPRCAAFRRIRWRGFVHRQLSWLSVKWRSDVLR